MELYVAETLHSAVGASADGASIDVVGYESAAFQVLAAGSPVGTVFPEGSFAESDTPLWFPLLAADSGEIVASSFTVFGQVFHLRRHGARRVRVRVGYTSGAFTVLSGKSPSPGRYSGYHSLETLHNAATASGNGTAADVRGMGGVTVHFVDEGSPSGTLQFEGTLDDTNWSAVGLLDPSGAAVTSAADSEKGKSFHLPEGHALSHLRARCEYSGGAFTVRLGKRP